MLASSNHLLRIHACVTKNDQSATNTALVSLINNIFKHILPTKARCGRANKQFYGTASEITSSNQKNLLALMIKVHEPCSNVDDSPDESVSPVTQSVFWSMASDFIFGKEKDVSSNAWTETAVLVNTVWIRINNLIPQAVRALDTVAIAFWWNVIDTPTHHFGDSTTIDRLKHIPASMCTKERGTITRLSPFVALKKQRNGLKQSKLVLEDEEITSFKSVIAKCTDRNIAQISQSPFIIPLGDIPWKEGAVEFDEFTHRCLRRGSKHGPSCTSTKCHER